MPIVALVDGRTLDGRDFELGLQEAGAATDRRDADAAAGPGRACSARERGGALQITVLRLTSGSGWC